MKWLLLGAIRAYWRLIPPERRRRCLFRESCSRHVYRRARDEGFISGLRALARRWRACRPGYGLLAAREAGEPLVLLADGAVMRIDQLSEAALRSLVADAGGSRKTRSAAGGPSGLSGA